MATTARPNWRLFLGLAGLVIVADQLSKAWLVDRLRPGESMSVVGDLLRFVHGRNTGALFGLFRDSALLFGLVSLVVIGLIVVYHGRSARSTYLSMTLGLLLGGAIGNVVDRFRHGYVVDFLDAGIGDLRWYTFNVADAAISFAILFLLVGALRPSLVGAETPGAAGGPVDGGPDAADATRERPPASGDRPATPDRPAADG